VTLVRVLPILVLTLVAAVAPLTPLRVVHAFESVGRYAAGDRGVDLAGVPGQAVVSATAGTVLFAGPVAGVGVVSVELGDGRRLTYEPVVASVRVGARLAAGAPLGRLTVGRTDCPAPACLHWGLVSGRGPTLAYADPSTLLGRATVRLLPLTGTPLPGPWSGSGPGPSSPPSAVVPFGSASVGPVQSSRPAPASARARLPPMPVEAAVLVGTGAGVLTLAVAQARRRGRASRRARRR
jgi:murein DD-endopeptidase MepM/ murein hydrolase activator NlpD